MTGEGERWVLAVRAVPSRNVIGTVELTGDGQLRATASGVQRLVERLAEVRGWDHRQAIELLRGYSNGYLEIVRVRPEQAGAPDA